MHQIDPNNHSFQNTNTEELKTTKLLITTKDLRIAEMVQKIRALESQLPLNNGAHSSSDCSYVFTVIYEGFQSLFDLFIYYISCCPSKDDLAIAKSLLDQKNLKIKNMEAKIADLNNQLKDKGIVQH